MAIRTWAIRGVAIALLALAALLGRGASHERDVTALDLRGDLARVGGWTCVEPGDTEDSGTVIKQTGIFEDEAGARVNAIFITTATRLGALRDYSVALEAQGWVLVETESIDGPPIDHLDGPMVYRLQTLREGAHWKLGVSWYVSSLHQAEALREAEFEGWWGLLTKSEAPVWSQVFATVDASDAPDEARESLKAFAEAIGPRLAEMVVQTGPDAGVGGPSGGPS
jgi:hypothetical protein